MKRGTKFRDYRVFGQGKAAPSTKMLLLTHICQFRASGRRITERRAGHGEPETDYAADNSMYRYAVAPLDVNAHKGSIK
jgi:hypothetical protein